MEGSSSKETHFRFVVVGFRNPLYQQLTCLSLNIISDTFKSKMQPARHRMVYALLKEEMDRPGGIHALQLRTKTPEEVERPSKTGS